MFLLEYNGRNHENMQIAEEDAVSIAAMCNI